MFAFVRPEDETARQFALDTGATWAGWSNQAPPAELDAALIFAPVGALVPEALSRVAPGGRVVCAGIHMSDIPSFPYRLLWEERSIRSVANLTRDDATGFLALAADHAHPDACAAVRARRRESGADRPAIRHAHGRCGAVSYLGVNCARS